MRIFYAISETFFFVLALGASWHLSPLRYLLVAFCLFSHGMLNYAEGRHDERRIWSWLGKR